MGKLKRKEPVRGTPSQARGKPNTITINSATTEIIRDQKILPVITGITSSTPEDRKLNLDAIPNLVKDETCRKLLLKEKIVKRLMEFPLSDPSNEVVMLAWAALRSLVREEQYDIAIHIYREKILVPIKEAVANVKIGIQNIASNPASIPNELQVVLWETCDTLLYLLKSICETTQKALDEVAVPEIIELLMGVLHPTANAPEKVQASATMCLLSLVEENEDLAKTFAARQDHMELLVKLSDVLSEDLFVQLRTVSACGIVHSLALEMNLLEDGLAQKFGVSEGKITSTLSTILKANQNFNQASDTQSLVLETALEVLASLATNVQFDLDEDAPNATGGDGTADDDKMMDGEVDGDEDDDGMEDDMDELDQLGDDMAQVVGEEGSIGAAKSQQHLPLETEQILKTLLEDVATVALSLVSATPTTPQASVVRLRALTMLNNLSWIFVELLDSFPPQFKEFWQKFAQEIWNNGATPILLSNTADVELAETLTGLCWALAKATRGQVDVSDSQQKAFMALYTATEDAELKAKCVGVLGSLAMAQGRIELNAEIGSFLIGLLSALPKTPAEAAVEALDILYEIYADKEFDYDAPVFVQRKFLNELKQVQPKVKAMTKRIDKRTMPELRERADEVQLNLGHFISYKLNEQKEK